MHRRIDLTKQEYEIVSSATPEYWFELNRHEKQTLERFNLAVFDRIPLRRIEDVIVDAHAYNILSREYYRSQDMNYVMNDVLTFSGFYLNHVEDEKKYNYSRQDWQQIMKQVQESLEQSNRQIFFVSDMIKVCQCANLETVH